MHSSRICSTAHSASVLRRSRCRRSPPHQGPRHPTKSDGSGCHRRRRRRPRTSPRTRSARPQCASPRCRSWALERSARQRATPARGPLGIGPTRLGRQSLALGAATPSVRCPSATPGGRPTTAPNRLFGRASLGRRGSITGGRAHQRSRAARAIRDVGAHPRFGAPASCRTLRAVESPLSDGARRASTSPSRRTLRAEAGRSVATGRRACRRWQPVGEFVVGRRIGLDKDVERPVGVDDRVWGSVADRVAVDSAIDEEVAGLVVHRDRPERIIRWCRVEVDLVAVFPGQRPPVVGAVRARGIERLVGVVAPGRSAKTEHGPARRRRGRRGATRARPAPLVRCRAGGGSGRPRLLRRRNRRAWHRGGSRSWPPNTSTTPARRASTPGGSLHARAGRPRSQEAIAAAALAVRSWTLRSE